MANLAFCDKHNMVAYLQKSEGSEGFHQIIDFLSTCHIKYALIKSPTIYVSLIEEFWQTAFVSTPENGEMEITATIDGKVKVVSEASIRRHLKLEDSDGISTLPNVEIFEQLALMGSKKTAWEQFSSNIATAIICLATNRTLNFSKLIFEAMGEGSTILVESHHTPTSALSTSQPPTSSPFMQTTHAVLMPHDSPIPRVHSLGKDEEDSSKQGRSLIKDMDLDAGISLVPPHVVDQGRFDDTHVSDQPKEQLGVFSATKVLADAARIRNGVENVHTYTRKRTVSTDSGGVSTASGLVSIASMAGVSTASRLVSTIGMAQEVEINIPSPVATKDKGKAVMKESEPQYK
ncbi:hypothetical protein Tco_1508344 [Tanacetum coccineum]